ncbi:MAG: 30S ribosomal protein S16 [candidate division Zixibacteria bacterium]|nr:30S ribosomal protein S16 [candidate division Zixibacteria bacterium]MBU1470394.1 30S ribosomal protein S16 [candidate division Zixibacteria bacterium]
MAVRIRLRRMGSKKRPFYRFVAADSRYARDGRFLETLGYYNPMEKPAKINVEPEKVFKWLKNGAQMSETVTSLFKQIKLLDKWEKVRAGESGDDIEIKNTIRERKKRSLKAKAAATEIKEEPAEEVATTVITKEPTAKAATTEITEEPTKEAAPETTEEPSTKEPGETDNS